MTVQGYGSLALVGTDPNKLPDGAGDVKYEQDYIRDKAWLWDRIGALVNDIMGQSTPAGLLLRGGIVTDDGSHTKVNISAGVGYAPWTISLGQSSTVPPTTGPEDLSAVRVSWGALSSQGSINVAGTWYVVMQYTETNWLSRLRAKAGGSWFFGKQPGYTLTISQTAPTAYQILLATIVSTGSAFTSITQASMNAGTQEYDLIINSNASLDLWCQAVSGQYKRVMIRAGAWTATALSPTAGVLVNLDLAGTTYVFAEKGSSINYSGSYAGNMYGLYHASATTDMSVERFENVKVNITNTGSGSGTGFISCTNLTNCTGTGSGGNGNGYGFSGCTNLTNCTGTGTGSGSGTGFISCANLTNCTGTGTGGSGDGHGFSGCTNLTNCTGTGSSGGNGNGYDGCTNLTNCTGTGISTGTGTVNGNGFNVCTNLTNCTGTGTSTVNGNGVGFNGCTNLTNCTGTGTGSGAGVGYGFNGCTNLTNCTGTGSSGGNGNGLNGCANLTNCTGTGISTGSGAGIGFNNCIGVVLCAGQGLSSHGSGYGFYICRKMQQNKPSGASVTSTYNTSYADSGSGNACADTAAGGYNS